MSYLGHFPGDRGVTLSIYPFSVNKFSLNFTTGTRTHAVKTAKSSEYEEDRTQEISYIFHRIDDFPLPYVQLNLDFGWFSKKNGRRHNSESSMTVRPSEQLEQVQRELARKLEEAERIGDYLVELGARLQEDPWKWSIDWVEDAFPDSNSICPIEPAIVESLDRHRLEWLLEDIRLLKRREVELKRLAVA
jgi:hypothetical protein